VALVAALCLLMLTLGAPAIAQDLGYMFTERDRPSLPHTGQDIRADVSTQQPARMLVIGDSLAQGFGLLLQQRVAERDLPIRVRNLGRASTGLARADFYDWPAAFADMVATSVPDIVVAHFGANDMQTILAPEGRTNFGSEDWEAAYRQQVRKVLQVAAEAGAVFYWLGPAPDGHRRLGEHLVRINPYFAEEARAYGAEYLPLTPLTAPNGRFERVVMIDGNRVAMRTRDGSHFTGRGYALVADHVLDRLIARFPQLEPANATLVVSTDDAEVMLQRLQ
jgi:hypothetical protein